MPNSQAQEWLAKAGEDEAVIALIRSNGGPWAIAAYHVQQAAEKHLKALLVELGIPPPKTHDLQGLLNLAPAVSIPSEVESAAAMTSIFAWLTRYPGGPPIYEDDVAKAEQHLNVIKSWVYSFF